VCIIRGKPITARNACQAVKCYPGPWPGGLMISWGILGVSSAHLHPFLLPSISSLCLVFFIHSRRRGTHYHCAHCYHSSRYDFISLPCGQCYYHSSACQYRLITVIICRNGFRPRIWNHYCTIQRKIYARSCYFDFVGNWTVEIIQERSVRSAHFHVQMLRVRLVITNSPSESDYILRVPIS